MLHLGIDPGLTGACAAINGDGHVSVFDTPTVQVKVGKTLKNQMDAAACSLLLNGITAAHRGDVLVTIEKVMPMPSFRGADGGVDPAAERRSMGATSAFNFGMGYGMWIGICAALLLPYQLVHPATWKRRLMPDMDRTKDAGRIKAMQLYPQKAKDLSRKKDVGRADAILLARYGSMFTTERVVVQQPEEMLF